MTIVHLTLFFLRQRGLLLIEKHSAGLQVHPTNAGHRAIAKAFEEAIE